MNAINGNFNWSNFLPVLNLDSGEKEGFNYFGLGYLIMFLLYVGSSLYNRNHKLNFGYILIIFIILLFSLSNNIDFGQTNIFKIQFDLCETNILKIQIINPNPKKKKTFPKPENQNRFSKSDFLTKRNPKTKYKNF